MHNVDKSGKFNASYEIMNMKIRIVLIYCDESKHSKCSHYLFIQGSRVTQRSPLLKKLFVYRPEGNRGVI